MEKKEESFLIENQDLIGAINSALSRGQDLKEAMMSLYNAGYEKEKIEEAARAYIELSRNPSKVKDNQKNIYKSLIQKKEEESGVKKKKKFLDRIFASKKPPVNPNMGGIIKKKEDTKKISDYGVKERKIKSPKAYNTSKIITFLLILALTFLVLILGAVFLFKTELIEFFNRLFV